MKNAKEAGIHVLFHTPVTAMNVFREGLGKYIKENDPNRICWCKNDRDE